MYSTSRDTDDREGRIRKMRLEQEEVMLKSDITALKRRIESAEMDTRVLERKKDDILAQIEEVARSIKKAQEELRMKEEDHRQLRKKMQVNS